MRPMKSTSITRCSVSIASVENERDKLMSSPANHAFKTTNLPNLPSSVKIVKASGKQGTRREVSTMIHNFANQIVAKIALVIYWGILHKLTIKIRNLCFLIPSEMDIIMIVYVCMHVCNV